jgi:hypothetical protein
MSKNGKSFWTTVPGILTGIASVITALIALFSFLGYEPNQEIPSPIDTGSRVVTPYRPSIIDESRKSQTVEKGQPSVLTLELTKLVALKTHCNCDTASVFIDNRGVQGAEFEMCYADERQLAIKKNFKHSVKVGLHVSDCARPENSWAQHEIITKDAYHRGPQTIRYRVGRGLYELSYFVR